MVQRGGVPPPPPPLAVYSRSNTSLGAGGGGLAQGLGALLACGGAYWPLALEPSAMTGRHPYYCGHPPAWGGGGSSFDGRPFLRSPGPRSAPTCGRRVTGRRLRSARIVCVSRGSGGLGAGHSCPWQPRMTARDCGCPGRRQE